MEKRRVKILDVPVDVLNMDECLEYVDNLIKGDSKRNHIFAVNPEKVITLQEDEFLRGMFEKAALLIPDGIGVALAIRYLFGLKAERVAGADLMQNICRIAPHKGYKIFIYGAKEEVNRGAVEELERRNPGISVVGRSNGYVKEEEMDELIERINSSGANILFIALGSPKQEKWLEKYSEKLNVNICMGIGGTLDTIVGTVKRAPKFMQDLGLEWFYRLLKQPGRIGRQRNLPSFAFRVLAGGKR